MFQEDINLVRQIVAEEIAKAIADLQKPVEKKKAPSVAVAPEPKVEEAPVKNSYKKL